MALLPQQPKTRQQALFGILIVVILATLSVFYFGYWQTPIPLTPSEIVPVKQELSDSEILLKEITERIKILDDDRFKKLKLYGKLPIKLEKIGRSNPYVPY